MATRPIGNAKWPPHLRDMTMRMFDRRAVRLHRDRAAALLPRVADLLCDCAERLVERLDDIIKERRFVRALDVGGRGVVAPLLRARGIEVVSIDTSPLMAAASGGTAAAADEEWLPFAPASFDLVVASLSLHWVNDLPGSLIQLRQALLPDGLLLASVPVLGTLQTLRDALTQAESEVSGGVAPRVSPFPDLRDCASLLQRAGYALPVVDREDISLAYADPVSLIRDLRAAGEQNALLSRDKRVPSRALFASALGRMASSEDGRVPVALRLAMMTAWAPHPSQPKPLPRGSGKVSLRDALESG